MYSKNHYTNNKQYYYNRNLLRKQKIKEFIAEVKKNSKCEECGEDHPACLDFHHTDPTEKEFIIGKVIQRRMSLERIKKEIEKCKILCSNCHRKLHYAEKLNCGFE